MKMSPLIIPLIALNSVNILIIGDAFKSFVLINSPATLIT